MLPLLAAVLVAAAPANRTLTVRPTGATQLRVQAESGDVHFVAAAVPVITVRTISQGTISGASMKVTRVGRSIVEVTLSGHASSSVPFALGGSATLRYEIVYPASLRLQAVDVAGNVAVERSRKQTAVEVQNGNIEASQIHGELDLAADAGDVSATLASDWRGTSIRMQSSQGNLLLHVPAGFRAHVEASSDNGTVEDTLPRSARGPFVWLYTAKGNVSITRL